MALTIKTLENTKTVGPRNLGGGRKVAISGVHCATELVHSQPGYVRAALRKVWEDSTLLGEAWKKPCVQWGRQSTGGPEASPQHWKEAKKQLVLLRKNLQNSATTRGLVPQRLIPP